MIPYMVGKLAPNSSHLTRGLVNMSPVGATFVPFPPKTGTNLLHPRPPPQSLNGSFMSDTGTRHKKERTENYNLFVVVKPKYVLSGIYPSYSPVVSLSV